MVCDVGDFGAGRVSRGCGLVGRAMSGANLSRWSLLVATHPRPVGPRCVAESRAERELEIDGLQLETGTAVNFFLTQQCKTVGIILQYHEGLKARDLTLC